MNSLKIQGLYLDRWVNLFISIFVPGYTYLSVISLKNVDATIIKLIFGVVVVALGVEMLLSEYR